jgi:predicted RNA-binding protein with PIN domain
MHWLIDGYNVIHRSPALGGGGADDREVLVNMLANASQRAPRDRFTVVFDGRRGGSRGREDRVEASAQRFRAVRGPRRQYRAVVAG